nr:non-ribosomal peptide synthetase [Kibdelosporangium phytohabitans]
MVPRIPASAVQRRMWLSGQENPELNVTTLELRWTGPVRADLARAALTDVVARHEALRTVFTGDTAGTLAQVVLPPAAVEFADADERCDPAGPVFLARFVSHSEDEHLLQITVHHLVFDGWSTGLLRRDLIACYEARARGVAPDLPALRLQLGDHARWEQQAERDGDLKPQYEYWEQRLKDAPVLLELPTDHARSTVRDGLAGVHRFTVTGADYQRIISMRGVTPSMVALAAFAAVLGRHAGTEDLLVATPVWGRTQPGYEDAIGCFINTAVLRVELDSAAPFRTLLRHVRGEVLSALSNQDAPFDRVVELLRPERRHGRHPLAQVMFTYDEVDATPVECAGTLVYPLVEVFGSHSEFELDLTVADLGDELLFTLQYDSDLFEAVTVQRLAEQYLSALRACSAEPDIALRELTTLPENQLRLLTEDFARGPDRELGFSTLQERFERQVAATPDAVALVDAARSLTFDELNRRANRLAHHLIGLGVAPDDRVAVVLPQGVEMVVALFGVLKAGAAFVPLDPAHPDERLVGVLRRAGVDVVVATSADRGRFGGVVPIDLPLGDVPDTDPVTAAGPDHLAYVFHTSGSTGEPKGAMTSHRSALSFVDAAVDAFAMTRADRFLQLAAVTFDVVVEEVFPALLSGGSVALPPRGLATLSPDELVELIAALRVTVCELTPVYWHELVRRLTETGGALPAGFRLLVMGGERPVPETLRLWRRFGVPLVHVYGLTETAVTTTVHLDTDHRRDVLPIGKPVANAQVYVLDSDLEPVPAGVTGELFVGGHGVGRGYVGSPALTAQRFVPDPFSATPGSRLYRTGDLARWQAHGDLEFLGRIDNQVKIRGHRVEPGEIESVLEQHPDVKQAFVTVARGPKGDFLAAYVVSPVHIDMAELRRHAAAVLPGYLVPSSFLVLDHLPRTTHGKTDTSALPAPQPGQATGTSRPLDETERAVAALWTEVLGVDDIGPDDDFFALGGHSMLGFQLVTRIGDELAARLPLTEFYQEPTIRAVAARIRQGSQAGGGPVAVPRDGTALPMSSVQERMWFAEQIAPGSGAYNVVLELRLTGPVRAGVVRAALTDVVARHEILRTVFVATDDEPPAQIVLPPAPIELSVSDLRSLGASAGKSRLRSIVDEAGARTIDLSALQLRAHLVHLPDDEHRLVISVHHIVFDGWSAHLFQRELAACYEARARGAEAVLPALPVQFADHAMWERSPVRQEALAQEAAYWAEHLADAPQSLELATDNPRSAGNEGGVIEFTVDSARYRTLAALGADGAHSMGTIVLAGLAGVLGRHAGTEELLIGTPVLGRTRPEVQDLIGCFINTVVLRLQPRAGSSFRELLDQVHAETLSALAHQEVAFDQVVDLICPERAPGRHPLVQVLFSYEYGARQQVEAGDVGILVLPDTPVGATEFDLDVTVFDFGDELSVTVQYNAGLFEPITVRRLADQLVTLLDTAATTPRAPLRDLSFLPPSQLDQLIGQYARGKDVPLPGTTAHQLVEHSVARHRDRIAVAQGDRELTYAELNRRANRLAHHLIAIGVQPDDRIGVALPRSPELLVAQLGVMKAGAAFVPLDPAHPADRLIELVDRNAIGVVVADRPGNRAFASCVHVDSDPAGHDLPAANPVAETGAEHLAYVIHTSGSTGRPKGVMTTHRGLMSLMVAAVESYGIDGTDRFAQVAPVTFDMMIEETYPVLMAGGTVVLAPRDLSAIEPADLLALLAAQRVTRCALTPAYWHELALHLRDSGQTMPDTFRLMIIGGDRHTPEAWQMWRRMGLPLLNGYGPTETSVTNTSYLDIPGDTRERRELPMGRPWANNQTYVLDADLRPVAAGVTGEVFIGGHGLARGYAGDPVTTAQRFVPNPFATTGGERLYRTGDLARWSADGQLEFVGRADRQVKIRGHRIEPGEVESVLERHPAVRQAFVTAHLNTRLVAYVVTEAETTELRRHATSLLPGYLVPVSFTRLTAMPLTANGKIDVTALPAPDLGGTAEPSRPLTATERRLAAVWTQLLGIDRVGPDDDFFALGGHSLLSYRFVSRVRAEFGVAFTLADFFTATTVSGMAELVERLPAQAAAGQSGASVEDILAAVETLDR